MRIFHEFFDGVVVGPADEVDSAREYELVAIG